MLYLFKTIIKQIDLNKPGGKVVNEFVDAKKEQQDQWSSKQNESIFKKSELLPESNDWALSDGKSNLIPPKIKFRVKISINN